MERRDEWDQTEGREERGMLDTGRARRGEMSGLKGRLKRGERNTGYGKDEVRREEYFLFIIFLNILARVHR